MKNSDLQWIFFHAILILSWFLFCNSFHTILLIFINLLVSYDWQFSLVLFVTHFVQKNKHTNSRKIRFNDFT